MADRAQKFVSEIDQSELAMRLIEIGCKIKRPEGKVGAAAFSEIRAAANVGEIPAYIVDDFEAMAVAAIKYFSETVSNLKPVN